MSSISGGPIGPNYTPDISVGSVEKTGATKQVQTQQSVMNNAMEAGLLSGGMQLGDTSAILAVLMAEMAAKMKEMESGSSKGQVTDQLANKKAMLNEAQAKLEAASQKAQQAQDQGKLAGISSIMQGAVSNIQGVMSKLNPFSLFGGGMKMPPPPPPPPPNTLVGIMTKAQQQVMLPKGFPNPLDTLMKFQQPPPPLPPPSLQKQNPLDSLLKGQGPQNMLAAFGKTQPSPPPPPPPTTPKTDAQTMQDMQKMMDQLTTKMQSQVATTNAMLDKLMGSMNDMLATTQKTFQKGGL